MSKKPITSSATILGNPTKVVKKEPTACVICHKEIPKARIEALQSLKTPFTKYTHVGCSTTAKIKGIYMGEAGTSEIKLCDKIYNDSVRSVFKRAEVDDSDDTDDKD
jgi:hypothetical protein